MADHPWPEAENREAPTKVWEVINDECHLYPSAPEMAVNLKVLQELNSDYQLLTYFHRMARFMFIDEYDEEAEGAPPLTEVNRTKINCDFLAGTVMGMHTLVEVMTSDEGQELAEVILNVNPLDRGSEDGLSKEDAEYIEQSTAAFRKFHTSLWRGMFVENHPSVHESLENITELLFVAEPDKTKRQDDFIKGFLFSILSIKQIKESVTSSS